MIFLSAMGGCSSPHQRRLTLAGDFNPRQGAHRHRVASATPEWASNSSNSECFHSAFAGMKT
jgi:hypothetical protein